MKTKYIDKLYTLKAGTEVFSTSLQENITFTTDVIVKITHSFINADDIIFACLQLKFLNIMVSNLSGKDETTFTDKANGEISTRISKLIKYKK